jgi:hypothetical protein
MVRIIILWIAQIGLCLVSGVSGGVEVSVDSTVLAAMGIAWAPHLPLWFARIMGACQLAVAIGIAVPALTGIMPILTTLAAACVLAIDPMTIGVQMVGSGSAAPAPMDLLSLILSLLIVWDGTRKVHMEARSSAAKVNQAHRAP